MKELELEVENIKCGGCANSITAGLMEDPHVMQVQVDVQNGSIWLEIENEGNRESIIERLTKMGYPETGSVEGLDSMKAKAKSFVSCAVGRMSEDKTQ